MPILIHRTARLISYQTRCSFATFYPPCSRVHALLCSPLCQKYICLASACDVVFWHPASHFLSRVKHPPPDPRNCHLMDHRVSRGSQKSTITLWRSVNHPYCLSKETESTSSHAHLIRECRPSHQAFVSSYLVGSRVKASNRSCHRTLAPCIPLMNVCNHPCRFAAMEATSQYIVCQIDISSQSVATC